MSENNNKDRISYLKRELFILDKIEEDEKL
jgi:hypothetical protein